MKAMILVLSFRESRDLLNGDLSVLVRKKFPSDYVGWVYIYVAKGGETLWRHNNLCTFGKLSKDVEKQFCAYGKNWRELDDKLFDFLYKNGIRVGISRGVDATLLNGKVVARFWCDKVEEIKINFDFETLSFSTDTMNEEEILEKSCLSGDELGNYLLRHGSLKGGYAIHSANLEIFGEPKEISEFVPYNIKQDHYKPFPTCDFRLTHAPRNGYCYIEVML